MKSTDLNYACAVEITVEPRYEVLGTMKITLLYIRFLIISG